MWERNSEKKKKEREAGKEREGKCKREPMNYAKEWLKKEREVKRGSSGKKKDRKKENVRINKK